MKNIDVTRPDSGLTADSGLTHASHKTDTAVLILTCAHTCANSVATVIPNFHLHNLSMCATCRKFTPDLKMKYDLARKYRI